MNINTEIKQIILNTKQPLLIKNRMNTNYLLSWCLADWQQKIGTELLTFRCGKNEFTHKPQWETTCVKKQATFEDFLNHCNDNSSNEWWYFDYKYLQDCSNEMKTVFKDFTWSDLGFPELQCEDSTIWIGSKHAHTSCHMDTYGCNVILQVYGRKQWLLFPPEENLKSTRIPYEESSIYSKLNFFSPKEIDIKGITRCYEITLSPGDVLILPHRWWHYVENLEIAISINVWLPLPDDYLEQIKESITAMLVERIINGQNDNVRQSLLNPNMFTDMVNFDRALNILKHLISTHKSSTQQDKSGTQSTNEANIEEIIKKYDFILPILELSLDELKTIILNKAERFPTKNELKASDETPNALHSFVDAVTDDDVVSLICEKLMSKI